MITVYRYRGDGDQNIIRWCADNFGFDFEYNNQTQFTPHWRRYDPDGNRNDNLRWQYDYDYFYFKYIEDVTLFKLIWCDNV
jgi:hypothetical protein